MIVPGAFLLFILTFAFILFGLTQNEDFGFSRQHAGFNVFKWGVRLIFVITFCVLLSIHITKCNHREDFNTRAKICGLGLHESPRRVSIVLDSLCGHNRMRFGEVITCENALQSIYHDCNRPNHYIVGCQDTLTGDRLEIQFIIIKQDAYDGESWVPNYFNSIRRISLKNEKGIKMSNVEIDSAYLPGGRDFNKGYCAMLSDTCAILYTSQ